MSIRGQIASNSVGGPRFRINPDRILIEVDGHSNLTELSSNARDLHGQILDESPVDRSRLSDVANQVNSLGFRAKRLENVGAIVAETDELADVVSRIQSATDKFSDQTLNRVDKLRGRARRQRQEAVEGILGLGNLNFNANGDLGFEASLRKELSSLSLKNPITSAIKELDGVLNAELTFTRNTPGPRNLNFNIDDAVVTEEAKETKPDVGDALEKIGVPDAWEETTGEGVVVAIFDTSFCSDFFAKNRIIGSFSGDSVTDAFSAPQEGHGTMTAYSMAGDADESGLGYSGVAKNAEILLARLTDSEGALSQTEEAWDWFVGQVRDLDRPVISNHSYGVPLCSARPMSLCNATTTKLARSINKRDDHQAFYAAGNEAQYCGHRLSGATNGIAGINSDPTSMTVAAFRYDLRDAQTYSSHGFGTCSDPSKDGKPDVGCLLPDIVPYGCEEKDMDAGNGFSNGGTSEASPITAGVAALVADVTGNAKKDILERYLEGTANVPRSTQVSILRGHDARFGNGQVMANKAVSAAIEGELPDKKETSVFSRISNVAANLGL